LYVLGSGIKIEEAETMVNFHLVTRRGNRQDSNLLTDKKNIFFVQFRSCRQERTV